MVNLYHTNTRGVATGWISVFIPQKSAQVNFLWGKNGVRTAIQQFYTPQKTVIPPKQISGYAPDEYIKVRGYVAYVFYFLKDTFVR